LKNVLLLLKRNLRNFLLSRSFSNPTPSPAKRCKTLAFFHRRIDNYLGTIRPAGWMTIPAGWMTVRAKVGTWNLEWGSVLHQNVTS